MLYNASLLLIHFIHSSLYLLIPHPFLPLLVLSPLVYTSLFSTSVCLFLLCIYIYFIYTLICIYIYWWKWKRRVKSWLKAQHSENKDHGIWSHHFMANRRRNSTNSGRLYFLGLQNHCRWWLQPQNKKTLTPWKKTYDQPRQHVKKQRHCFGNKGPSSQGYVFPVVMYGCESCTIKKAEHQIIDAFELWCWRRLLRVPWTARRSNQSILKEISPGCSLEGLMLKLATWCKQLTHLETPWCWERLKAGGEGDDRGWDGWMVSPIQWIWVWVNSRSWWWMGRPGVLQSRGLQRVRHDWVTELNWTDTFICIIFWILPHT